LKSNATSLPLKGPKVVNNHGQHLPKDPNQDSAEINMNKFQILTMTKYQGVLFLDADWILLGNLDYLFYLSDVVDGGQGSLLQESLIMSNVRVPFIACCSMLKPKVGAWEQIQKMAFDAQVNAFKQNKKVDIVNGFGHQIQHPEYWEDNSGRQLQNWTFYRASFDKGMLLHWTKYVKKSVSILFSNDWVKNWGPSMKHSLQLLERTLFKPFANFPWYVHMWDKHPKGQFLAGKKPWKTGPTNGSIVNAENAFTSKTYYW
jgi:hypothetical protein